MADRTAVQYFVPENPNLTRTLRGKLHEHMQKLSEALVKSYGIKDFPDYQRRVGVIEGLNTALTLCDEADKELGE